MGWGTGVVDGQEVGYAIKCKCAFNNCNEDIDKGLAHACGGSHGTGDLFCDRYFCDNHLKHCIENRYGQLLRICTECYSRLIKAKKLDNDDREIAIAEATYSSYPIIKEN